jgi:hypothetical protein
MPRNIVGGQTVGPRTDQARERTGQASEAGRKGPLGGTPGRRATNGAACKNDKAGPYPAPALLRILMSDSSELETQSGQNLRALLLHSLKAIRVESQSL